MTEGKNRDVSRAYYVRTHAPALLAGMLANSGIDAGYDLLRAQAIEQAGLLFDETETE